MSPKRCNVTALFHINDPDDLIITACCDVAIIRTPRDGRKPSRSWFQLIDALTCLDINHMQVPDDTGRLDASRHDFVAVTAPIDSSYIDEVVVWRLPILSIATHRQQNAQYAKEGCCPYFHDSQSRKICRIQYIPHLL